MEFIDGFLAGILEGRRSSQMKSDNDKVIVSSKIFSQLESYRKPMRVNEIMMFVSSINGTNGYYVCPKCKITLEWEFMDFCDRCGQKLDWRGCKKAKVIYPGSQNIPIQNVK